MRNSSKNLALAAALTLLAAAPAHAQQGELFASNTWYAGLAGGPAEVSIVCNSGNCNQNSTAWKLYGGVSFPNHFGAELGYTDLGSVHGDSLTRVDLAPGRLKASYVSLAAVWSPPVPAVTGLVTNFKLGVALSDTTTSGTPTNAALVQSGAGRSGSPHWYLAAGLGWKIDKSWSLTADYDYSSVSYENQNLAGSDSLMKETVNAGVFLFGARYSF